MQTTTTTTVETAQNQFIVEQSQSLQFPGQPQTLGAQIQDVHNFLEARQRSNTEALLNRLSVSNNRINSREDVQAFVDNIRQEVGALADTSNALGTNLTPLQQEIVNLVPRVNTATEAAFRHFRDQADINLVNNVYSFIRDSRVFRQGVIHTNTSQSSEGVVNFFSVLGENFVDFLLPLIQNHSIVRVAAISLILRYFGWLLCFILNRDRITIAELISTITIGIERARIRLQVTVPRELNNIFTRFRAQVSDIQSSWVRRLNSALSQTAMRNFLTFGLGGVTTALLGGSLIYFRLNPETRASVNNMIRSLVARGGELNRETIFNFRFIWDNGLKIVLKDKKN